MRKFPATAFLLICASTGAVSSQIIAKVELPCESPFQIISAAGTQMAVQCKDRSLHLIDLPQGTEEQSAQARSGANTFTYSPDGRWLAMGFEDGTIDVVATH